MCLDIDECASPRANPCHPKSKCLNTPGSFECLCPSGWTGDGHTCTNPGLPDECDSEAASSCSNGSACALIMAYQPGNFDPIPITTCECLANYRYDPVSRQCIGMIII